jgi:hypothetical protein
MNPISQSLHDIAHTAQSLLDGELQAQQRTFVQHMHNIAQQLNKTAQAIPDGTRALQAIVPTLPDAFGQQCVALYGYAKLMLESPVSFDHAPLNDSQRAKLTHIYDTGLALSQWLNSTKENAFQQRKQARHHAPQAFDVCAYVQEALPIYRYWLKDHAVTVQFHAREMPFIHARAYHVGELLRHIVVTLGTELVAYGAITLSLAEEPRCVAIHIACTGVQFLPNELQIVFEKNGRNVYREQLDVDEGYMTFEREKGVSGTAIVHLPKAQPV